MSKSQHPSSSSPFRRLLRLVAGLVIALILFLCLLGWVLIGTDSGHGYAVSVARSYLKTRGMALESGRLVDVGFASGVFEPRLTLRNVKICSMPERTWCFEAEESEVSRDSVALKNACGQVGEHKGSLKENQGPTPLTTETLERLFSTQIPFKNIRIENAVPCPLLGGKGGVLVMQSAEGRVDVTATIDGVVNLKAKRTADSFAINMDLSEGLYGASFNLRRNLEFEGAASLLGVQSIQLAGRLEPGERPSVHGAIDGLFTGNFAVKFGDEISLSLDSLQYTLQQFAISIGSLTGVVLPRERQLAFSIASAGVTSEQYSISDLSGAGSCQFVDGVACQATKVRARKVLVLTDLALDQLHIDRISFEKRARRMCVETEGARFALFGGGVSSKTLNSCRSGVPQNLTLKDIQMAPIAKRFLKDKLEISGSFNAELPLFLQGSSLAIKDGTFESKPPGGKLSYLDSTAGLPDVARKALDQFDYSEIRGKSSYHKGILSFTGVVVGKSAALQNGRAIKLNLNWEEDVGALLKVYRLTNDLHQALQAGDLQ